MTTLEKTVALKAKYLAARTGILFSLENTTYLQFKQKNPVSQQLLKYCVTLTLFERQKPLIVFIKKATSFLIKCNHICSTHQSKIGFAIRMP